MTKPAQLFISHKKHDKPICNCTMCPMHNKFIYSSEYHRGCRVVDGTVKEPEISWCNPGIGYMWIATHQPDQVIELLSKIGD